MRIFMDKPKLAERLGAPPDGSFQINDMQLLGWGSDIVFVCVYQAEAAHIPFQMILHDCREMHWRIYAHPGSSDDQTRPPAALVNLRLGSDQHRKPLNMLTDYFGLTVLYGVL